jgi:hypothetical protein
MGSEAASLPFWQRYSDIDGWSPGARPVIYAPTSAGLPDDQLDCQRRDGAFVGALGGCCA